jgi:hypothetical protein
LLVKVEALEDDLTSLKFIAESSSQDSDVDRASRLRDVTSPHQIDRQ